MARMAVPYRLPGKRFLKGTTIPVGVVYLLRDPITQAVRYVGKTTNPQKRWQQHNDPRCFTHNPEKHLWICYLRKRGLMAALEIIAEVPVEGDALDREEARLIDWYWANGADLLNYTGMGGRV